MLQPLPPRSPLELLQLRLEEATSRTVLGMLLELHLEILQYKNSGKCRRVFSIIILRLICLLFFFMCFVAHLHQASATTQSQCYNDASDIGLIEIKENK